MHCECTVTHAGIKKKNNSDNSPSKRSYKVRAQSNSFCIVFKWWLCPNLYQNLPLSDWRGWPVEEIECCHMTRPLISSGSATSFSKSQLAIFTFSRAEVQFSEQRRCGAEETKRLGLSDLFSGRASCSLIRISNCGTVWESWCSVTNASSVSVQ